MLATLWKRLWPTKLLMKTLAAASATVSVPQLPTRSLMASSLVGFYQTVDYTNPAATQAVQDALTSDTYGLGGELKVGSATALKAMWLTRDSDADNFDSDMLAVGIEHKLDKAVRVYANYAMVENDENVALTPWSQARTANPAGALGEDATGFSVGLRYDF